MRRLATGAVLAASGALLAGQALAAPVVTIGSVTATASAVTVTGTAAFDAAPPAEDVGGTNVGFANAAVADAAGINLTSAAIQQLPDGSGLRFIWNVTGLPAQTPPEGVRYTWGFKIGESTYQLQAKRTNLASATTAEDPLNHVKQAQAGDFFQLRGACTTAYLGTPVSGCYHLAFLKGTFDVAGKRVTIDLPYETRDQIGRLVAPEFKPGALLEENQSAGMSIAAAFQAVIGNTTTSDYINGWSAYTAGRAVSLATGARGDAPEDLTWTRATLTGSDYTGTVARGPGANTVFVRACQGLTCTGADRLLG